MNTQLINNEATVLTVTIEQDGYTNNESLTLGHIPSTGELANIVLNLAFTALSVNRLICATKDKVKLSIPFTFAIAIECGNKFLAIPDITTKISLDDKGVEKLIKHLPKVIALTTMDYTLPVMERIEALKNPELVELVLN